LNRFIHAGFVSHNGHVGRTPASFVATSSIVRFSLACSTSDLMMVVLCVVGFSRYSPTGTSLPGTLSLFVIGLDVFGLLCCAQGASKLLEASDKRNRCVWQTASTVRRRLSDALSQRLFGIPRRGCLRSSQLPLCVRPSWDAARYRSTCLLSGRLACAGTKSSASYEFHDRKDIATGCMDRQSLGLLKRSNGRDAIECPSPFL